MASYSYTINAKLIFQVSPTGSTPDSFDPITGEPIFSSTQEQSIVEASLEQNNNFGQEILKGTDEDKTYLIGRCINPKTLTKNQREKKNIECEIMVGETWIKGRLELKTAPISRLGLENYFGERIEGFFATQNNSQ